MNVYVKGGNTTKFGELWEVSPRDLAKDALSRALKDARMSGDKIEALFVGNMLSGLLGNQEHLGSFYAEMFGNNIPAFKIEGACASGGLAVHNAVNSILSGQYKNVAVLGIEKMTDYKPEVVAEALMGAGSEEERNSGITFPGLYAILARAHMDKFGTKENELAAISVKNHYHASLNPKAQFQNTISLEQVITSSEVAGPLKLLECSPISDGASVLILSREDEKGIQIVASSVATDSLGIAQREKTTELKATKIASSRAYNVANIKPGDIDVAEVHDCFSIAEILAMEDLGFYKKGEAAEAITGGATRLHSSRHLVVNTSGGLEGCGHPVGATGVKQIVELFDQLLGRADKRQVKNARIGLAQNVGGSGGTAVITILKHD